MDTAIIAKAPVRLLVAGMGDALSTGFQPRPASTREPPAWRAAVHGGGLEPGAPVLGVIRRWRKAKRRLAAQAEW